MWTYIQSTGEMINPKGVRLCMCYSGAGEAKNRSTMQNVRNIGPIPVGSYYMIKWIEKDPHMGLGVIVLEPFITNNMFDRSGMCWHGDNNTHTASHGCIVGSYYTERKNIWSSSDHILVVV